MFVYKGVPYELTWKGRWEWKVFADSDHATPTCQGTLEGSGPSELYQAAAEASIRVEIDELLNQGVLPAAAKLP